MQEAAVTVGPIHHWRNTDTPIEGLDQPSSFVSVFSGFSAHFVACQLIARVEAEIEELRSSGIMQARGLSVGDLIDRYTEEFYPTKRWGRSKSADHARNALNRVGLLGKRKQRERRVSDAEIRSSDTKGSSCPSYHATALKQQKNTKQTRCSVMQLFQS
jgi:hypothetical protein